MLKMRLTFIMCMLWINIHGMEPLPARTQVELQPPPQARLKLPYTQSLAQLYYVLKTWTNAPYAEQEKLQEFVSGNEYKRLKEYLGKMDTVNSPQEKWDVLKPKIAQILTSFFRGHDISDYARPFSDEKIDKIVPKLIPILEAEVKHHGYYIAYRGGGAYHGFLIDLFSEFLSQAKNEEISAYRVDLDSFDRNIKDFYNRILGNRNASQEKYTNYKEIDDFAMGTIRYNETNGLKDTQLGSKESRAGFGAYGASFSSSILDLSLGESALTFWGSNISHYPSLIAI